MTGDLRSLEPQTSLDPDMIGHGSARLIGEIADSIAHLLDLKAALEKKNALSPSLQQGLIALENTLNSAEGYLSVSKLYYTQGMYKSAAEVLNKGMKEIPSSAPHYASMTQQLERTTKRLNACIDIIAEAPYDLLNSFVELFDRETYYICLQVSHTWRNRVLQCPGPWRDVIANEASTGPLPFIAIPIVTHHIVSLSINDNSHKLLKCLEVLRSRKCSELRELWLIDSSKFNDAEALDLGASICDTMLVIGHQLSRLQITAQDVTNISLTRVLEACKNLRFLIFEARSITDYPTAADIEPDTSLESISLKVRDTIQDASVLGPLLQSSPRLRMLFVDNCVGSFLSLIEDKCPILEKIRINESQFDTLRYDETYSFDSPKALTAFAYCDLDSLQYLQKRLEKSANVIESICIAPTQGTIDDWRFLSTYNSSSLTHLYIDVLASPACRQCVVDILRNFPSLESVRLDNYMLDVPDAIFDSIASMQRLQRLRLKYVDVFGEGFGRLLNRLAERDPRNYSQGLTLELVSCAGTDAFVLMEIVRIRSLGHLTIINPDREVNGEDIVLFSQEFAYMPRIYSLELGGMIFTDIAALNVSLSPYLNTIYLHNDVEGLTVHGFAAFQRCNITVLGPRD
ncbi:hypothetical protein BJV82DRAFT_574275 [Fennellomyces sp. T-0311]|nr:hypothetical protein BJV82DRAFT_574275 [Fennellomyces sp. T-0311]